MSKWEYFIWVEVDKDNIAHELHLLGDSKWELVSSVYDPRYGKIVHYLKREVTNT